MNIKSSIPFGIWFGTRHSPISKLRFCHETTAAQSWYRKNKVVLEMTKSRFSQTTKVDFPGIERSLVILKTRCEATRELLWVRPRNFDPRSGERTTPELAPRLQTSSQHRLIPLHKT
ncbi:hypothetical protein AVEN_27603-1 [Araneus ventricosus]|uniref:Uncharacterized protein n=1 Tax=Araneus ventricosus TaxID=182803 RepID=A0A4Y2ERN8_ARAVE|nr:hypothetical protein AVEN_27603-1 [Araneus ventricosus]